MSISKHYRYKKPGDPFKVYPNLMATGLNITGPLQCITSDMTAFRLKGVYYELTLYIFGIMKSCHTRFQVAKETERHI